MTPTKTPSVADAVEGFDVEALEKMLLRQLIDTFPRFDGAPDVLLEARAGLLRKLEALMAGKAGGR